MEQNKTPGVRIEGVHLINSCVNLRNTDTDLPFELAVTDITRKEISSKELRVVVNFDLLKGIEKPAFTFTVSYGLCYTRNDDSSMTWDDLNNGFVLTHVLPYFREFASSVTLRLPVPALVIPPTNVKLFLQEYEENTKQEN